MKWDAALLAEMGVQQQCSFVIHMHILLFIFYAIGLLVQVADRYSHLISENKQV